MLKKFFARGHRKRRSREAPGSEQPAEFYDEAYRTRENYHQHYTKSIYYFLWCVIVDRLRRAGVSKLVDIGCGPGQFAALVRDTLEVDYCGIDFSPEAVEMARRQCGEFSFLVEDMKTSNCLAEIDYDCVVSLEFLEHISTDLEVMRSLKSGVRGIMSVPNFNSRGHVRFFSSVEEVKERYGEFFTDLDVQLWQLADNGHGLYLMDGAVR